MEKQQQGIEARKFEVGERIAFEDFVIQNVINQYGETELVSFADQEGKIIRKSYASGLAKFLKDNRAVKSVCLKKKLMDGPYTHNLWSE